MPPPRHNVLGALFDIKPVDASGSLDVAKIQSVLANVNLRRKTHSILRSQSVPRKASMLQELETTLNASSDHRAVLSRIGTLKAVSALSRPRYRPILKPRPDHHEKKYKEILSEIHRTRNEVRDVPLPDMPNVVPTLAVADLGVSPAAAQIERWFAGSRPQARIVYHTPILRHPWYRRKSIVAAFSSLLLLFGAYGVLGLRDRVIEDGSNAVNSLQEAKANLSNLDFAAASESFLSAYEEFSSAGTKLNLFGASLSSVLGELPGGEKLKSAQQLVQIGKLIASTGQSMSDVMTALSRAGLLITPGGNATVPLAEVIQPLTGALEIADTNLKEVRVLLADLDTSVIPEEKRASFEEFSQQFPQLQQLVSQGSDFADFLEALVSVRGTKRYLILFQNNSELRPTGGFPGSYALITFEKGRMKEYSVGDVYDLDGQMKELVIPPKQLQHITPTWAMRDANWFIDFPTSAKKIMSFFRQETGFALDGVFTISPDVFKDILAIIGPVEMPAYNLTVTSENFLATLQNEVEYGPNKKDNKPKKIIMDMAPVVMAKLAAADHNAWLSVFNAFIGGLDRKDMLMYFKDLQLQAFALEKGFSGEVKQLNSDYLMVTMTNVKGSKTDVVTDTVMKLGTRLESGMVTHSLVLGRMHNGGKTDYGFYNKQNPAFVRILVPKGSQLTKISGHSIVGYRPLVEYDDHFNADSDLERFENTFTTAGAGVWTYEEAGKTGFAFWMVVDPGNSRAIELEYTIPTALVSSNYSMYIQKQPGLKIRNFHFEFAKPEGLEITASSPTLHTIGDVYSLSGTLEHDLLVSLTLQ